jgi:hypothetical protein
LGPVYFFAAVRVKQRAESDQMPSVCEKYKLVNLGGSPTFALGHAKTPLNRAGATWRRHHPNPAEATRRWRGNGIAGLAAGSSRHRQKNRGNATFQRDILRQHF